MTYLYLAYDKSLSCTHNTIVLTSARSDEDFAYFANARGLSCRDNIRVGIFFCQDR